MENNTPAVNKQTFWVQIATLASLILVTLTENEWFMDTFTQTGAYAGMALTGVTIVLGFLNPIGHKKNLEMLDEENQADDGYGINNLKP